MKSADINTAVMTVVGRDQVGIIAKISTVLSHYQINIKDITQTIMDDLFTMIMIIDLSNSELDIKALSEILRNLEQETGLSIKVQLKELFNAMHRI